jgi:hypothetical protein
MEQYIATAIEKEVMDAINRLSPEEKEMLLVFTMLDELMQSQSEPEPEPEKDDIFTLLYKEEIKQMEQEQLMQKQITEEMLKHLFG